jgi:hypothetical protein
MRSYTLVKHKSDCVLHARVMHVPTAAQPHLKGVRVCTSCTSVCAATFSVIHPLCLSVCLYMYIRVYNRTPTEAHTSWYSRHLCHILESVGRHQRDTHAGPDTHIRKTQKTTLRGAGARAHERRTGVVAAEGAVAKGYCPCLGLDRQEMPRCLGLFGQEMLVRQWHLVVGKPALC